MSAIDALLSSRPRLNRPHRVALLIQKEPRISYFSRRCWPQSACLRKSFTVQCNSISGSPSQPLEANNLGGDVMSRVLRESPSQVEPRYLRGDKFYTFKEEERSSGNWDAGVFELLMKKLKSKNVSKKGSDMGQNDNTMKEDSVYLNDLLRDCKGKLYVPEQVFGRELSEEEEFDANLEVLPKMSFEDFRKAVESGKVMLLTSKETTDSSYGNGYRDFIVDLKESPGDKSLHKMKWALKLNDDEVETLLEEYTGPQYEIEKQTPSWVGKLPEYPHPVASSLSSRMMVELGMVTAVIAVAAVAVGGFLASAVFVVTSLIFATSVYVVWPAFRPFFKLFIGITSDIVERLWDNLADIVNPAVVFSKIKESGVLESLLNNLRVLLPIVAILLIMVLTARFKLSKRSRNFKRWDLWQGIEFSRSKAEARVDGSTGVKFCDVAGIEEAVEELQELVRYLKNPELFDKMGIKPPHGVLLEGPPGCGKTLVAKAIAGEAGVPFYEMAGSEFVEVLVGVGSARIRDLFKRAKVNKPSVIFVDEIDAMGTRREGIYKESTDELENASTQERETTLNQLLTELDGFDTGKGVIFLAATNRRDLLDPALLRPGRFDRKIRIRPPNAKGRHDILKIHAGKVKMSESVDLSSYALNLPGWTGARLAQLVQEAALVAVRKGHHAVLTSDMDDAVDRLTIGPRVVGINLGHQGQCRRATTEVGVAMISHLLRRYENADVERCDRISLKPRGETLSQLIFHRLENDKYRFERLPQLLHRLQVFLGGRAAEEVIYGPDTSSASASYLGHATWLSRKILTIWNLENPMAIHGEAPPWTKKFKYVGPRLDFEGALYTDYCMAQPPISDKLDDRVAERTEELMCDLYKRTLSLLRRHDAALLKAAKVLLEREEISGEEIDFILDKYPPQTPVSLIMQEKNPGSLPQHEQAAELEYALASQAEERDVAIVSD